MFRIKANDSVVVLSGKNRKKRGKVLRLLVGKSTATVEGLNLVKRHLRRSQNNPQGNILSRESPMALDRLQPICPRCNRGVRVGFKVEADGSKVRVCRRCQEAF